jgi:hypothetical protein
MRDSVPDGVSELIESLRDPAPATRASASAALERLTRTQPHLAEQAHAEILAIANSEEQWLARMNVCRMCPLVAWLPDEYELILEFLFAEVARNEGFVAAWALNALAQFAATDESIKPRVMYLLEEAEATGSPALRARARKAAKALRQAKTG